MLSYRRPSELSPARTLTCFGATAKVVSERSNSAMDLTFEQVSVKSELILRQWLIKASGGAERIRISIDNGFSFAVCEKINQRK
jgi:hypothetical protein